MTDAQILALFDGRGTVEITLRGREMAQNGKLAAIAHELGYKLHETDFVTRGQTRLRYLRDDSPEVRRRAQQTQDRLRAGGPLLPVWGVPGAQPGATRPISAIEIASARRNVTAYETNNGAKGLVVFVALLSLGFFLLTWVQRDSPGAALALATAGVSLGVVATLTPRWMRQWYERNRRLVRLYDQQRSGRVGPPPPPPPLSPPPPLTPPPGPGIE
jgi:hypothetical protein